MALLTRSRPASWCALAVALLAAGVYRAAAPAAEAAPPLTSSEAVYAAFTVNLTRFVSWPEGALGAPGEPFIVGTYPRDPVNAELDAACQGESIAGHPVRTIRLRSLDDVLKCRVVFLSRNVGDSAAVLARAQHRPILTISDAEGFLALGGHVRFLADPPHTRLQISAVNLRASGLEARAQLMRIATAP